MGGSLIGDLAREQTRFASRRLGEQAALWLLGTWAACFAPLPMLRWCGVAVLGLVYARNLEFAHACIHGTFLRGARANRIAGIVLSLPMLVSFCRWRREHAEHHRDVEKEGFRYDYPCLHGARELLLHAFMVRHFADAVLRIVAAPVASGASPSERRDYLLAGALAVAAIVAAVLTHGKAAFVWPVPLAVAALVHTHIELPEHLGLERSDRPGRAWIVAASPFCRWLAVNNCFHAVHHLDPGIPLHRLPATFESLERTVPFAVTSYARFYRALYADVFSRDAGFPRVARLHSPSPSRSRD
jgi:fatty acid desaturase